jgi:hypothetical protein
VGFGRGLERRRGGQAHGGRRRRHFHDRGGTGFSDSGAPATHQRKLGAELVLAPVRLGEFTPHLRHLVGPLQRGPAGAALQLLEPRFEPGEAVMKPVAVHADRSRLLDQLITLPPHVVELSLELRSPALRGCELCGRRRSRLLIATGAGGEPTLSRPDTVKLVLDAGEPRDQHLLALSGLDGLPPGRAELVRQ